MSTAELRQALARLIHNRATTEDVKFLQGALTAGQITLISDGEPVSGDIITVGSITGSVGVAIGRDAKVTVTLTRDALKLLLPRPAPFMAEKPPANFVERPKETQALLEALLAEPVDSTSTPIVITTALRGAGGFSAGRGSLGLGFMPRSIDR